MTTLLLLASISMWRMGGNIHVADAPDGAALRTMGGDIRVDRGAGTIIAKTMGGNIDIDSVNGSTEASTMGGEIHVSVVGVGAGHNVDLYSMGGNIELILPVNFNGRFTVETENGTGDQDHQLISDFPLQTHQSTKWRLFDGRRLVKTATGQVGSGTNFIRIKTLGGDIIIRKK